MQRVGKMLKTRVKPCGQPHGMAHLAQNHATTGILVAVNRLKPQAIMKFGRNKTHCFVVGCKRVIEGVFTHRAFQLAASVTDFPAFIFVIVTKSGFVTVML